MQSPSGNQRSTESGQALGWAPSVGGRPSVREQAALLGPVERQIEFDEARRSEFDGLPALQDHLDQLGAQKGEADETPDIATGDGVAPSQMTQRSGVSS